MATAIHWFPGHMKKALNELIEKLKVVDIIIEIVDARAPISSINPNLEELTKNKKKILILSKSDLADKEITPQIVKKLKEQFNYVLPLTLKGGNSTKLINASIKELGKEKHQKEISKGMKPQPLRVAVIGVPNVGKSSLINLLAGKKVANVENKPGLTRGEQWVKINSDYVLLDTPGILPMNYEDHKVAINIALIGSIRETILPNTELVDYALKFFKKFYPDILSKRFGISSIGEYSEVLATIAEVRKLYMQNNELDILKAESLLLKELKDGTLGLITFDRI